MTIVLTVGAAVLALLLLVLSIRKRHAVAEAISQSRYPQLLWWLRDIACGLAIIFLCALALEQWNGGLLALERKWAIIELLLIAAPMIFAYAIAGRRPWVVYGLIALLTILGVAQHYASLFRGLPILPTDLHSVQTAAAVAEGYDFTMGIDVVIRSVSFGLMALACALMVTPIPLDEDDSGHGRHGRHEDGELSPAVAGGGHLRQGVAGWALTAIAALASAYVGITLVTVDYAERFGYKPSWWDISETYAQVGTLPTLVGLTRDMSLSAPAGWSEQEAQELMASLAGSYDESHKDGGPSAPEEGEAATSSKPHVVVVMNETYSDLTIYDRLHLPAEAKPFFLTENLPGTVESGAVWLSVLGGNTCNSEYELLTGDSLLGVGSGKIVYTLYGLREVPSLAKQLDGLGYRSIAIHPHHRRNWNRDLRYDELGFDDFLDHASTWPSWTWDGDDPMGIGFHGEISDEASYEALMNELKEVDGTGKPLFLFDVTVQNHGGYDKGNVGEPDAVSYDMDGINDGLQSELNEYLGCVNNSSRALRGLMDQLEALDDDVILLFFGDHQPVLSRRIGSQAYSDISSQDLLGMQYQTCYFIWRNHSKGAEAPKPVTGNDTSANYLAARTLEAAGLPLSEFQKAQLTLERQLPAVCVVGAVDEAGAWRAPDDDAIAEQVGTVRSIDWLVCDRYLR